MIPRSIVKRRQHRSNGPKFSGNSDDGAAHASEVRRRETPPCGGQSDRRSDPEVFTDSWRSSRFSRDKSSSSLHTQAVLRLLLLRETDVSIRSKGLITDCKTYEGNPGGAESRGGEASKARAGGGGGGGSGGGGGHRRVTGSGKMAVHDIQQTIIPHVAAAFDTFETSARESR